MQANLKAQLPGSSAED